LEVWTHSKEINSFGEEAVKKYNSNNFEELSNKEELSLLLTRTRIT